MLKEMVGCRLAEWRFVTRQQTFTDKARRTVVGRAETDGGHRRTPHLKLSVGGAIIVETSWLDGSMQ
jgi:hypothetical protein